MKLTETKRLVGPGGARLRLAIGILLLAAAGLVASSHSLSVGAAAPSVVGGSGQSAIHGEFPVGSYRRDLTREVTVKGVTKSVKAHILIFFTTDGQVVVILETEEQHSKTELGSYTVEGDELVISDSKEHRAQGACAESGRYKWDYNGKVLVFTKVTDGCEGRAEALAGGPLSRYSPEK